MVDDSYKVWLIEVNTNPCLETACPLLSKVIPEMLDNMFKLKITNNNLNRITLDVIFPPPVICPT
jgi:tubulin monoglycylase TTLL3/8